MLIALLRWLLMLTIGCVLFLCLGGVGYRGFNVLRVDIMPEPYPELNYKPRPMDMAPNNKLV